MTPAERPRLATRATPRSAPTRRRRRRGPGALRASASSSTCGRCRTPERAPLTAAYLEALLDALDADPQPGESFSFLLAADLDDPIEPLAHTSTPPAHGCSRPPGSSARAP